MNNGGEADGALESRSDLAAEFQRRRYLDGDHQCKHSYAGYRYGLTRAVFRYRRC